MANHRMISQKNPLTGHGHAGKTAPLIAQAFRNKQIAGLQTKFQIPLQITATDHRRFRTYIQPQFIFPPGIEYPGRAVCMQMFHKGCEVHFFPCPH